MATLERTEESEEESEEEDLEIENEKKNLEEPKKNIPNLSDISPLVTKQPVQNIVDVEVEQKSSDQPEPEEEKEQLPSVDEEKMVDVEIPKIPSPKDQEEEEIPIIPYPKEQEEEEIGEEEIFYPKGYNPLNPLESIPPPKEVKEQPKLQQTNENVKQLQQQQQQTNENVKIQQVTKKNPKLETKSEPTAPVLAQPQMIYPIFENDNGVNVVQPQMPIRGSQNVPVALNLNEIKVATSLKSEKKVVEKKDQDEVDVIPFGKAQIDEKLVRRQEEQMCIKPKFDEKRQLKKFQNVIFFGIAGNVIAIDSSDLKSMSDNEKVFIWKNGLNTKTLLPANMIYVHFEPLNELLYVTHKKNLFCFNPNNGLLLWQSRLFHVTNQVCPLDDGVYTIGIGHFQRFDKKTGKETLHIKIKNAWSIFHPKNGNSQLLPDGKFLYIFANGINKFDRSKNEFVYQINPSGVAKILQGLKYDDDHLLLCSLGYMYVFNSSTQKVLRTTKIFRWSNYGVAMMLRNKTTLIISSSNRVLAYHPLTHQKYWEYKWYKSGYPIIIVNKRRVPLGQVQSTLNQDEKQIYVAGAGRVAALNPKTGEDIWITRLGKCDKMYTSTLINVEKNMLLAGCRGWLFGLDTRNGKIMFTNRMRGYRKSHISFAHYSKFGNNVNLQEQPYFTSNWSK